MSQVRVSGNASGTGVLTVTSPNTNSNYTLTLPAQTGTILTNASTTGFPAGSVLQVVQATSSTYATTTSNSFVTTGFSASITPSSTSSKVLVIMNLSCFWNVSGGMGIGIYRNGSSVFTDSTTYGLYITQGATRVRATNVYLDSPASVSSVTYTAYIASYNGGTVAICNDSLPSSIVLLEIAG